MRNLEKVLDELDDDGLEVARGLEVDRVGEDLERGGGRGGSRSHCE